MKLTLLTFFSTLTLATSLAPYQGGNVVRCMALTPACMGDSSNTRENSFCYQCQNMYQGYTPTFYTPLPSYYPWWYGYGQYQYTNMNYPGYWQNGGLSNHYYPGGGNMAAGKPNIYFHGLSEQEAKEFIFQIKYSKDANELASTPIHNNDEGWKVRLDPRTKNYIVDGDEYSYLYYDYKFDSKALQNEKGFCGERAVIYEKMVQTLNTMKFKDKEVTDFENYWAYKIPKGEFCVFPQDHSNLSPIAQWNSSVQPKFFKRILFVVIPMEQIKTKTANNFTQIPKSDWNPMTGIYRNTAAQTSEFQIHEWGLAFLTK